MLLICLVVFYNAIFIAAEENDSFETRYIDLLPAKEKKEFIENIARRILEEIKSNDKGKNSTELSEDQLNIHSQYVSKLLKDEAESLRRRTKEKNRLGRVSLEDAKKHKSIDFTLRELADKNGRSEKSSSNTDKIAVADDVKNATDNISVEVQIVHEKKKNKKGHNSRIFQIPVKSSRGSNSAPTRENATMIVIGSENKPLLEKEIQDKIDDVTDVISKNSSKKDDFNNKNDKKEGDHRSDQVSENEEENYRNKNREIEAKDKNIPIDKEVNNEKHLNPARIEYDSTKSNVRKEDGSQISQNQDKAQIYTSDKVDKTVAAVDDIAKQINNSRRKSDEHDNKDLIESDKIVSEHKGKPKISKSDSKSDESDNDDMEISKPVVGIEDDLRIFNSKPKLIANDTQYHDTFDKKSSKEKKQDYDKPIARNKDQQNSELTESDPETKSETSLSSEVTTHSLQELSENSTQVAIPGNRTDPLLQELSVTTEEMKKGNFTEASREESNKETNTVNMDDTINTGNKLVNNDVLKVNTTTESALDTVIKVNTTIESALNIVYNVNPTTESVLDTMYKVNTTTESALDTVYGLNVTTEYVLDTMNKVNATTESALDTVYNVNPTTESALDTMYKVNTTTESALDTVYGLNVTTEYVLDTMKKVNATTESALVNKTVSSDEDNSTKMGDILEETTDHNTGNDSKEDRDTTEGIHSETTTEDIVKARTVHITWYPGHTTIDYDKETTTEKCQTKKTTIELIQAKTRYVHWPTEETPEKNDIKKSASVSKSIDSKYTKDRLDQEPLQIGKVSFSNSFTTPTPAYLTTTEPPNKEKVLAIEAPVIIKHNQVYIVNDGMGFKEQLTKRITLNKNKRIDLSSKKRKKLISNDKKDIQNFQIKPFGINMGKEWSVFEVLPGEDPFVKLSGKPSKKSKKIPKFNRNNVQRAKENHGLKNVPRSDDVDSQMEQPHYAPVYNYAPENAYFNPANRYASPYEENDENLQTETKDDTKNIERQNLKEVEKIVKSLLESQNDDPQDNHYAPVYNFAPENAYYNPENRYAVPDEDNDQIFRIDTEGDTKQIERQRQEDEKIVKSFLESQNDEPEDELLFREDKPHMRKGAKNKKNILQIPGSNERDHPYNAMLNDDPPKTHLEHVREILHKLNYFGYYHLVKTSTGYPELTTRFPINAPFTDKSGDPYNDKFHYTTDVPDIPTIPEPGSKRYRYSLPIIQLRSRNAEKDLINVLKSLLNQNVDDDYEGLPRSIFDDFDGLKESDRKHKRKKKKSNKYIGMDYFFNSLRQGDPGTLEDFDEVDFARAGVNSDDNKQENTTQSASQQDEMIETMRVILNVTDATHIFPALDQIQKKYEKPSDDGRNTSRLIFRSPRTSKEKAKEDLESQVLVLTDMLNCDNRALEKYDWLSTTVDIRSAMWKLINISKDFKDDVDIYDRDLELLKYVLSVYESAKDSEETEARFMRISKPEGQRAKARRNLMIFSPWLYRTSMKDRLDPFIDFCNDIKDYLADLHGSIKEIALETKYESQSWYKDLKKLYLTKPKRKQVLEVLLHLVTTRFVGLLEDNALDGAERNHTKYLSKHEDDVKKTKKELVSMNMLLKELKKET